MLLRAWCVRLARFSIDRFRLLGLLHLAHSNCRFAFYSVVGGSELFTVPDGACFSQYSDPIPITSVIGHIDWINPPVNSSRVHCIADGVTPIDPVPVAQVSTRKTVLGFDLTIIKLFPSLPGVFCQW